MRAAYGSQRAITSLYGMRRFFGRGPIGLLCPPLGKLQQSEAIGGVLCGFCGSQAEGCLSAELFLFGHATLPKWTYE